MKVKIRTLYLKVKDIQAAAQFWEGLLQIKPHKYFDRWCEFWCGNIRLGLLSNDFNDRVQGSGCVPVFEFDDEALPAYIARARSLGAKVVLDGLENPKLRSIVFRDPEGHEFELSKFHDD
ncbi:MAG: VOC family protein [Pseudomonadota bacterium]|nr:VOC family protein [Pseudomonadota bacterium]